MPDPALQFLRPISALTYPGQAPPGWVCSLFLPGIMAPWFPPPPGRWHTSPWANQRRALHALTSLMPMVSIIHCAPRRPKPVFFTIHVAISMPFNAVSMPFAAICCAPRRPEFFFLAPGPFLPRGWPADLWLRVLYINTSLTAFFAFFVFRPLYV